MGTRRGLSINNFNVDGASEECAASESLNPIMTLGIVANNSPEQTLEVAVGREHDPFKTSQFSRPRKLRPKIYEP